MHLTSAPLIPVQSQEADYVLSLKPVLSEPDQHITNHLKQLQRKIFKRYKKSKSTFLGLPQLNQAEC